MGSSPRPGHGNVRCHACKSMISLRVLLAWHSFPITRCPERYDLGTEQAALRGPALRGPALRGPALRGPALRGPCPARPCPARPAEALPCEISGRLTLIVRV